MGNNENWDNENDRPQLTGLPHLEESYGLVFGSTLSNDWMPQLHGHKHCCAGFVQLRLHPNEDQWCSPVPAESVMKTLGRNIYLPD